MHRAMREFSIAEIKQHLAYAGEPTKPGFDLDELRWRMYQWRRLGLVYFSERLDRLVEEGRLAACFAVGPSRAEGREGGFVPEPFPVLAEVYEALERNCVWDRVTFLSRLAHFKLAHESDHTRRTFADRDDYGLYCAFIDRFYDTDRPYRGKRLYWILFDEKGVEFFSDAFNLDAGHLEKFMAPPRRSGRGPRDFWRN